MNKYKLLLNTLDSIIREAQDTSDRNRVLYNTSSEEKANQARSRSLIHLYLRTRFGIINILDAEKYITEGSGDGGLDAYYIDQGNKIIYLVQSKFRTKEINFENRPVDGYELFKMYLREIINGDNQSRGGKSFNGKIQNFQRQIREITNIGQYRYHLVFLGNVPGNLDPDQLKQVTGSVCDDVQIINGKDTYKDLLLPYVQSDYYNKKEFVLKIIVNQNQSNRINYAVNIDEQPININLAFIPTLEVAKMMHEYKNSLLKYNPRCYVGIKNGGVNQKIQNSISKTDSNEFSLLNNGITIICSDFQYTDKNAEPGIATLLITNPQIVNGGQTAVTLAKIYSDQKNTEIFGNKEVLVKFISLNQEQTPKQISLIEKISEATNDQTPVALSDRKSNDPMLISLQNYLFENYGVLLERKRGEFFDALHNNVVSQDNIISKDLIMRLAFALKGKVSEARSYSNDKLFRESLLSKVDFEDLYKTIKIYKTIDSYIQRTRDQDKRFRVPEFGNGLKYGKFAITKAVFDISKTSERPVEETVDKVKKRWIDFETTVQNKEVNKGYYIDGFNYDNYYKGKTINIDLVEYFR